MVPAAPPGRGTSFGWWEFTNLSATTGVDLTMTAGVAEAKYTGPNGALVSILGGPNNARRATITTPALPQEPPAGAGWIVARWDQTEGKKDLADRAFYGFLEALGEVDILPAVDNPKVREALFPYRPDLSAGWRRNVNGTMTYHVDTAPLWVQKTDAYLLAPPATMADLNAAGLTFPFTYLTPENMSARTGR